jgi:phenylalanyl-tRNA synthetase beta chain
MFVSYRWLVRHVDLAGISPEETARALTLHTAEVEQLAPFAPALGSVVCGHVLERRPHPNADRLSLCRVDVGEEELQIVCGAPNVAAGQRVAVARVGAELESGVRIKKTTIRGVESQGMICSERELGLGDEHEGIWVLGGDAPLGHSVASVLGGPEGALDWVLSIDNKSLTHRPDLWGHRGLARELAAIFERALRPLELELPPCGNLAPFPVRIETPNCSRYVALPIDGVRIERSPDWLRHLLLAVGQRPIDLLVDLSNFVMLDLGQPNHLFDRRALSGQGIWIRDARAGERITTLDGVERRLEPSDMLIGSGEEPVALAGVMGGEGSKVEAGTSELLLEVASFHPTVVRRTAARLSLRTEASSRFEKHLDPNLPMQAAAHLVRLLRSIQPSVSLPARPTDAGNWKDPARTLALRSSRVRSLLGVDMEQSQVGAALRRLGFAVRQRGEDLLDVDVPSFRATKDITIEEDLIEEVGRLVGYGAIPERELRASLRPTPRGARAALARSLADELCGSARFHEVMSYSFVPSDLAEKLGIAAEPCVEVINPVLDGWQRVRRSVVPGLIGHVAENLRRREVVELFELGKGYLPEHRDERGQPREVHEVGLVRAAPRGASVRFDAGSYAVLRGLLALLLQRQIQSELLWRRAGRGGRGLPGWAHPGRSAEVVAASDPETPLGLVASLEPGVARALGLVADVAAAWISIDALLGRKPGQTRFHPIARFPSVKVDVALALPAEVEHARAVAAIARAGKGLVSEVELFDVYTGSSVGEAMRSLAYHVVLEAEDRTLSEADCQKFLDRVEREASELGGQLRREPSAREAGGQASPARVG